MNSIQELLKEIKNLKPIPAVANQLLAVVDNPDSSMEDIANVIQYDPIITASVLKICNSAFFGLKNPAESIKDAVNMLGTDQVIELVVMKSGAESLSGKQEGYGLENGDIWKYSVASAVLAKQIAVKLSLENKSMIFTSALIKDIGKIILEKYVSRSAEKIQNLLKNKNFSFREAEKKILGIDHAELGAMIAKMWNFSPKMVKIIRHHHLADETMIKDKEIAAVYLADCLCMMLGIGVGSDGLAYRFKNQAMKELGISADDIAMIIAEFGFNMQEVEELLQIV
ncbi:HDOD domain-containing protein [Desulfobacula toluolica]|uniref:Putative chemotaxis signal transduction protein n=1 Tax=Desulfobacula toluolica (strain DSM 7467 / Tol2) TaxID=651182 RepID=K0NJA1_DESTT|nr:HDOD domain-containing protein [Desulfobacula toluolica]CCK79958.1 putative chemotaxis signal transduction protein [Desulfobacula toluolica Tol2]